MQGRVLDAGDKEMNYTESFSSEHSHFNARFFLLSFKAFWGSIDLNVQRLGLFPKHNIPHNNPLFASRACPGSILQLPSSPFDIEGIMGSLAFFLSKLSKSRG